MPLLHMEFERIGACHRPYTQKRSCLPPLIRLPFGQPPSPRGRHPSDESVHFYVVQPYPLRATQAWPTSPCTPGGSASPKASPEFVRAGHATAPTRKNDRAYRPSSVCPSGSHLPPGEGIPQMGRYTFTLSNRTPSTLTIGFCEKFRERGKIVVEFMGVLCYDNAVSIWACCALK